MSRKYFGTDGIRGRVGRFPMTPDFIMKLGWAAGKVLTADTQGRGRILIGKDTRISGYMFEAALEAGLSAAGVDVQLLGPMPTPAIAYLTQTLRADAGIVISASHNPFDDNGIKFFGPTGHKLSDAIEQAIEALLEQDIETVDSENLGKASRVSDAPGRYIEFCKGTVSNHTRLHGLKIVLDCANGATYQTAPQVFRELGAEVVLVGAEPDGLNINENCGSLYPDNMQAQIVEAGADVGIALDGDGDRVIMMDASGQVVDGDQLLYVLAKAAKDNGGFAGGVVGTLMTNLGMEHSLAAEGIAFSRAQVGDRYVMEVLRDKGWALGGESSGHIICLNCHTTGDGIIAALQILTVMQQTSSSLAELIKPVEMYPQILLNVRVDDAADKVNDQRVLDKVKQAEARLADSGRVLLRASGTEPLIRVMVEGSDAALVKQLAGDIAAVVEQISA